MEFKNTEGKKPDLNLWNLYDCVALFRYHKRICFNLPTLFQITFAPMNSQNFLEELFLGQQ